MYSQEKGRMLQYYRTFSCFLAFFISKANVSTSESRFLHLTMTALLNHLNPKMKIKILLSLAPLFI